MNTNKIKCGLCGEIYATLVYEGPIRSGVVGKQTDGHRVVRCIGCGLVRLEENPIAEVYYESGEYRIDYNETDDVREFIDVHDQEQPPRLQHIGIEAFRDKVVLDYGCGGGAFLDLVKGVASKTVGVEPFSGYHDALRNRGHEVYSSSAEALNSLSSKVDTIVSFGVIEHVEKPSSYLKDAFDLLSDNGVMYLETDNLNDILLQIGVPGFELFFYRTAHLWYFDSNTLERISEEAGFSNVLISHRHNFDLSNSFLWAIEGNPTGCGKLKIIDKELDAVWINFVEKNGFADLVCAEARK